MKTLKQRVDELEALTYVMQKTIGSQTLLLERLMRLLVRTGALPEQPPPPPSN